MKETSLHQRNDDTSIKKRSSEAKLTAASRSLWTSLTVWRQYERCKNNEIKHGHRDKKYVIIIKNIVMETIAKKEKKIVLVFCKSWSHLHQTQEDSCSNFFLIQDTIRSLRSVYICMTKKRNTMKLTKMKKYIFCF